MNIQTIIKKNTYFDSVSLMAISTKANAIEGVTSLNIAMGTDKNKEVLRNANLYTSDLERATNADLMIVFSHEDESEAEEIIHQIEAILKPKRSEKLAINENLYYSLEQAITEDDNLVVISVPGQYAAFQAQAALNAGKHVMMFSDNVSLEDELKLKQYAHDHGLLVMGPDCGTAIIGGKGLCFANAVRRGPIGIVAASGTGAQELSVRIHDFGGGVSQLVGVGGRDLSAEIGGIMMLDAMDALEKDKDTEVIVLISKQPDQQVANKIYQKISEVSKPVVVCFIGGNEEEIRGSGAIYAKTTKRAALEAVKLMGIKEEDIDLHPLNLPLIEEIKTKLLPSQTDIKGFFCGGTIAQEVAALLSEELSDVKSNFGKNPLSFNVDDLPSGHVIIDFGADEFTVGKPHPMIDPSTRLAFIEELGKDPNVGVLILDFVLGYGAHKDPVGVTLPAIQRAKERAKEDGRHLEVLGFILGTENDPQSFTDAAKKLDNAGVTWASSVENTGLLARGFVKKGA